MIRELAEPVKYRIGNKNRPGYYWNGGSGWASLLSGSYKTYFTRGQAKK